MTKAIEKKIGLDKETAKKIAGFLMDTFGYELRVIDNVLNPEERQLFYILQAEGFLTTGREQTRLHDGREWLTHYWQMQMETILRYANDQEKTTEKKYLTKLLLKNTPTPSPTTIYDTLSDEMWTMRKTFPKTTVPHR